MSDHSTHNNNNKVFQIPNMTERQSSTNRTFTNNNNAQNNIDTTTQITNNNLPANSTQHQHFINMPQQIPQLPQTNILQQLGLPPIQPQPPAAFQPVQPVAIPQVPAFPIQPVPIQPNLNASAPAFTPNPCANIPLLNTPNTAQAPTNNNILAQNQMAAIKQKVNESMAKLQILSLQLNTLNLMNQQNQTLQSLQQYQTVYQQYQLELTNTFLLNQYLQNLNNIVSTPTPQGPAVNAPAPVTPATPQLLNGKSSALETIEEGEEEEMEDNNNNIAAIAGTSPIASISPMTDNEGTAAAFANAVAQMDEMKNDTLDNASSSQIGEHESAQHQPCPIGNFQKLLTSLKDTETDTTKQGETNQKKKKKCSELERIKKQIRGILNKITPENFDKLSQEIASILKIADIAVQRKQLQTLTDEELKVAQKAQFKALIKLILKCILEKAINDSEKFCNQYARLCYSLYLYAEQNELKKKLFRQQLLSLCHSVFKKARNSGEATRFIGIITMIGELFTYGLISWNVISSGIFDELLPPKQALDIEGICKLLKVSGHNFDRHHYKEVNTVMNNLSKYAASYDFRTQCFVKDIWEMRKNDWRQRKDTKQEKPQTLNQIHKEFNAENKNKKVAYHNNNHHQQQPQHAPGSYNNHNNNGYHNNHNQTQSYRPQRNNHYNDNNGYHHSRPRYNNNNNRGYDSRRNNGGGRWRNNHYNNNNSYHHNGRYGKRKSKNLRPTVEFVKDVTLPDRSHYPENKVLTKTWAMRNSGELSWGDDVELVYFKGDETLSLEQRYPVINAQPGQQVEISASIRTPTQPGRYCTYFRLQKNGKFFGPRVWVDIIVSPQHQQQQSLNGNYTKNETHNKQEISCQ